MYATFDKAAAAQHLRYMRKKAACICVDCKKQDDRTLRGLTKCQACYERDKAGGKSRAKQLRIDRREWGVCTKCGKADAYTQSGRGYCSVCCEAERVKQRARFGYQPRKEEREAVPEIPARERYNYGMCYFCRAPLADRRKDNGERVRVCESCWQRCAENARNAKKAWYEKREAENERKNSN